MATPSILEGLQPAPIAALDRCVYMRQATTEDGKPGFALLDADGDLEMFSENRSDVFFYIAKHELTFVLLN
jgi:hypothetical protein